MENYEVGRYYGICKYFIFRNKIYEKFKKFTYQRFKNCCKTTKQTINN